MSLIHQTTFRFWTFTFKYSDPDVLLCLAYPDYYRALRLLLVIGFLIDISHVVLIVGQFDEDPDELIASSNHQPSANGVAYWSPVHKNMYNATSAIVIGNIPMTQIMSTRGFWPNYRLVTPLTGSCVQDTCNGDGTWIVRFINLVLFVLITSSADSVIIIRNQ